jgi:hypothetical protein
MRLCSKERAAYAWFEQVLSTVRVICSKTIVPGHAVLQHELT